LTAKQIIPECQLATKPGVQGRDLLSAIAQMQKWARRHNIPLYVLQRDQKKGFDMLEPQGFYDAITAYGLPSSIADLDRSAQAAVPYRIKTAYGFTDPFIVNGVTKQGGSLSPVKCMLTTSMCSRWLTDLASTKPGQLLMRSTQACWQQPHSSLDNLEQLITMIEAMDDSLLITTFLPLLLFLARPADQFQAVYGWETEWLKSALYALYAPEFPPTSNQCTYPIPSVDYTDPSSSTTFHNPVNVITDFITFLRVPIDQPDLQF
jgi:hypothetical protein